MLTLSFYVLKPLNQTNTLKRQAWKHKIWVGRGVSSTILASQMRIFKQITKSVSFENMKKLMFQYNGQYGTFFKMHNYKCQTTILTNN
jgi:hypothetical protein